MYLIISTFTHLLFFILLFFITHGFQLDFWISWINDNTEYYTYVLKNTKKEILNHFDWLETLLLTLEITFFEDWSWKNLSCRQSPKLCNFLPSSSQVGRNAVDKSLESFNDKKSILINSGKVLVHVYRKFWTLKPTNLVSCLLWFNLLFTSDQKRLPRSRISTLFL